MSRLDRPPPFPGDRRGHRTGDGAGGAGGDIHRRGRAGRSRPRSGRSRVTALPAVSDPARDFVDVSRGNPKPHTLKGEALSQARLTAATWRLEVVGDGSSEIARPCRLEDRTALDLAALEELGKTHGVKYLKAMQCNNIPSPLGQGLWEGVPLREVINQVGRIGNVRRVYFWGFHNNDPAQLFQSSLPYNRVMETPPWEPPPMVAYRLNGEEIPLERGGPVRDGGAVGARLQVDQVAPADRADQRLQGQRYLCPPEQRSRVVPEDRRLSRPGRADFKAGEPIEIEGTAMAGWSGLRRVEYWLRPAAGADAELDDDDPAWKSAVWRPCEIMPPPDDWGSILPAGTSSKDVWGFDPATGKPRSWPLPFSMVPWTARLEGLKPGSYEFRVRTVDLNGFAQPEPRPYQKSGMNRVPMRTLVVTR